jgi:hypothetical protein
MEDYCSAFRERAIDTHILQKANRSVGCVHNGGVTIECILKAIVIKQNAIIRWKDPRNPASIGIENPGHDLMRAISLVPVLRRRLSATPGMEDNIRQLQRPIKNYIFMRYENNSILPSQKYSEWLVAYKKVLHWIHSQKMH